MHQDFVQVNLPQQQNIKCPVQGYSSELNPYLTIGSER